MVYGDGFFLSIAGYEVYRSEDAREWSQIGNLPMKAVPLGNGVTRYEYYSWEYLVYIKDRFYCYGVAGNLLTSVDGTAWKGVNIAGYNIDRIIYAEDAYYASTVSSWTQTVVLRSEEGTHWEVVQEELSDAVKEAFAIKKIDEWEQIKNQVGAEGVTWGMHIGEEYFVTNTKGELLHFYDVAQVGADYNRLPAQGVYEGQGHKLVYGKGILIYIDPYDCCFIRRCRELFSEVDAAESPDAETTPEGQAEEALQVSINTILAEKEIQTVSGNASAPEEIPLGEEQMTAAVVELMTADGDENRSKSDGGEKYI